MFLERLRDGSWLTRSRLRLWAIAVLLASAGGLIYLLATSDGLNDYQGRPLGTDFSNTYVAGRYILDGMPEAPFDPRRQFARAKETFGAQTPMYGWHYPPFFHFIAAPLATMPYLLALALWQGVTLLLYLLAIRAIARASADPHQNPPVDRGALLLLAIAFPAVFVNIGHGQNGFLTVALVSFALVWLDRRPVVAGVLFGLLAYKPQYGLLIPLVLAATGRWRTILAAGVTVMALVVAVTLAFGIDTWRAFFASAGFSREVLEHGGRWHMIQSVFAWVRLWGGDVALAYAVQAVATLGVAVTLVWLWRSPAAFALKAAALCTGMVLATPYSIDYDLMMLAPAIAFLGLHGWQRGFAPFEITLLAAAWTVPLVARSVAQAVFIPVGVIAMLALFLFVLRRARVACSAAAIPAPRADLMHRTR
jgi:alpha-1,2-mannosyltransferase